MTRFAIHVMIFTVLVSFPGELFARGGGGGGRGGFGGGGRSFGGGGYGGGGRNFSGGGRLWRRRTRL